MRMSGPDDGGGDVLTTTVDERASVAEVLDALVDGDCWTILQETSDAWRSVGELVTVCESSQSTVYRKVDTLESVGLLEGSVRIRETGAHVGVYTCPVSDLTVSIADGDVRLTLEDPPPATRYGRPRPSTGD